MSKLTNWIGDTDSLDIQGIVDKYEADLINNQSNTSKSVKKETVVLDGQEVWSGSLDDFNARNTKAAPIELNKTINNKEEVVKAEPVIETVNKTEPVSKKTSLFDIDMDKMVNVKPSVEPKIEKPIIDKPVAADIKRPEVPKFEIPSADPKRPEVPKFEIPGAKPVTNDDIKSLEEMIETKSLSTEKKESKTISFDIPNLFDKTTRELQQPVKEVEATKPASKTVNLFDTVHETREVKPEPKVEVKSEPTHSYKDEMVKKQLSELAKAKAELEAANELVKKQLAEMAKAKEELEEAKKQEAVKAPTFIDNKTISFDTIEKESKGEIKLENPNTKILDNEPVRSINTKTIKFVDKDEEPKKEPESESKNKFASGLDFYKAFEANDCKTVRFQPTASQLSKDNEPKEEKINKFTKRLTKIFFNETQKADDLDLTRELDHSKGISVEETHHSETKKKKGFFGFFKKKVKN